MTGADILCDALEAVGVERVVLVCGPDRVVTHRRRGEVVGERFTLVSRHEGPASKATGREAFAQFAPMLARVQAVVCTNNFLAQGVAVVAAITAGFAVYGAAVWVLRVPEARQIRDLLVSRGRSRG